MSDQLNEKNTKAISVCCLLAVVAIVIGAVIGNTLAAQSTERVEKQSNVQLVECIKAGKTAVECRTLIYGSR